MRSRIFACFQGKSIGGAAGMPFEGKKSFLQLSPADCLPAEPVPNDDLDLQLVWLQHVKEVGAKICNLELGQAWLDHIDAHPDEYGVALWNLKRGITPPLSGIHNNFFTHGMGAAIRAEIWAALCAGNPLGAAYYAYQDASVDHYGEGVYAEMFIAAVEAKLFASEQSIKSLPGAVQVGLSILPADSVLRRAILDVLAWHEVKDYDSARDSVMEKYGSHNFTDCIMNLCFILVGLLYGEGDFEKSLLLTINCGQDTDCTAATVAACLGIMLGEKGIPRKWKNSVGEEIIVGDYIKDMSAPNTLSKLVDEIEFCRNAGFNETAHEISLPFKLPAVEDFSDNTSWLINGKTFVAEGILLPLSRHENTKGDKLFLETGIRYPESKGAQMMVCSEGIFRAYFDDVLLGTWGEQSAVVPAFHRVRGGRVYNIKMNAGQRHAIKIELFPTAEVPDVIVAFADMDNRHLVDLRYV
jgi:ADP-ribosylglycohydrolase